MSVPLFTLGPHALTFGRWDFHDNTYVWVNDSFDGYGESGTPFFCSITGNVQRQSLKCDEYGDYDAKTMKTLDKAGFSLVVTKPSDVQRGKQFDDAVNAVLAINERILHAGKDDNWFFSPLDVYDAMGCRIAPSNTREAIANKDVQVVFTLQNRVGRKNGVIIAVIDHGGRMLSQEPPLMFTKPSSTENLIYTRWHRGPDSGLLVRYCPGSVSSALPAFCVVRGRVQPEDFQCGPFGDFHLPRVTSLDDARFTFRLRASQNAEYATSFNDTLEGLLHVRSRIDVPLPTQGLLRRSRKGGPYLFFEQPVLNTRNEWHALNVVDSNWKRVDPGTIASRMKNADVDVCTTLHYTQLPGSISMFGVVRFVRLLDG
ncbi:hypothetical protein BDN72DRAFT_864990 [Pluteus cervinus]|uniref:Uncharacterized protein n=1 Tax=Pluteus cervinus TaxID=181527 RepID=A0ACD3A197_9AGAR|nr:hypothetical protein BDN72DRAFT_864990 [Pluteus cervinus]